MSKHCDCCMTAIEKDKEAIKLNRQYIMWRSDNEKEGFEDLELCCNCAKRVMDAIVDVVHSIREKLTPELKKLFVR